MTSASTISSRVMVLSRSNGPTDGRRVHTTRSKFASSPAVKRRGGSASRDTPPGNSFSRYVRTSYARLHARSGGSLASRFHETLQEAKLDEANISFRNDDGVHARVYVGEWQQWAAGDQRTVVERSAAERGGHGLPDERIADGVGRRDHRNDHERHDRDDRHVGHIRQRHDSVRFGFRQR